MEKQQHIRSKHSRTASEPRIRGFTSVISLPRFAFAESAASEASFSLELVFLTARWLLDIPRLFTGEYSVSEGHSYSYHLQIMIGIDKLEREDWYSSSIPNSVSQDPLWCSRISRYLA